MLTVLVCAQVAWSCCCCQGPAPVDPGNLKRGWSQSLGKDYLIRNIKRLGKNSVVGKFSGEKKLNNLLYAES